MWEIEAIEILRNIIDDPDSTKYTDVRLKRLLIVAAFQVLQEAAFTTEFTVDISEQTITPDPTDSDNDTRDDSLVNLMCLKAACIMERGVTGTSAGKAVAGKDGFSSFDLRGVAEARLKLMQVGACKEYANALSDYQAGGSGSDIIAGAAVLSPFRTNSNHRCSF